MMCKISSQLLLSDTAHNFVCRLKCKCTNACPWFQQQPSRSNTGDPVQILDHFGPFAQCHRPGSCQPSVNYQ